MNIVDSREQHFGNNKYINHAKKIDRTPFPNKDEQPYRYNASNRAMVTEDGPTQQSTAMSIDFGKFKATKPSKATSNQSNDNSRSMKQQNKGALFARNLFGDEASDDISMENTRNETSRQLFLIPETNGNNEVDMDQFSIMSTKKDKKRISARKLEMEESFTRDDDEGDQPNESNECTRKLFGEDEDGGCHTPSKPNAKMLVEDDDFLNTVSALRVNKNKMDLVNSSESTDAFTSNHSSIEVSSFGSFHKSQPRKHEPVPYSRFKTDYEDLEVIYSSKTLAIES